jgi:hypothetical protein
VGHCIGHTVQGGPKLWSQKRPLLHNPFQNLTRHCIHSSYHYIEINNVTYVTAFCVHVDSNLGALRQMGAFILGHPVVWHLRKFRFTHWIERKNGNPCLNKHKSKILNCVVLTSCYYNNTANSVIWFLLLCSLSDEFGGNGPLDKKKPKRTKFLILKEKEH